MSPASARRACVVLASHTGWGRVELEDLELDELNRWLDAVRETQE